MPLIVITGAPGSGKSTLVKALERTFGIARVRPLTSRRARPSEIPPDNDYVHVDRSELADAIQRNEVAFWDEVAGELYGVLTDDLTSDTGYRSLILPAARIPDIKQLAATAPFFLSPLGVVPREVVDAVGGCLAADASVGSVVIVVMEPGRVVVVASFV